MGGHFGVEAVRELADIFLAPEVADFLGAGDAFEVGPFGSYHGGGGAQVEEAYGPRAIGEGFGVDFEVAGVIGGLGGYGCALLAEGILIYVEYFVIGKQADGKWVEVVEIATE